MGKTNNLTSQASPEHHSEDDNITALKNKAARFIKTAEGLREAGRSELADAAMIRAQDLFEQIARLERTDNPDPLSSRAAASVQAFDAAVASQAEPRSPESSYVVVRNTSDTENTPETDPLLTDWCVVSAPAVSMSGVVASASASMSLS